MADSIFDILNPHFQEMAPVWSDIMAMYGASPRTLRSNRYIVQRYQGESDRQFQERLQTSDFMPLFAVLMDFYLGRSTMAETDTIYTFQAEETTDGMGNHLEAGTISNRFWTNLDGAGTNWQTNTEDAKLLLLTVKEVWGIADGVKRNDAGDVIRQSRARIIEPWSVPDYIYDDYGTLLAARVNHTTDVRTSLREEPDIRERCTVYEHEGFQVYEKDEEGEEIAITDFTLYGGTVQDPFMFYSDADKRTPILPVWRTELSLRRNPGEILAAKNVSYYNQESERDNLLRVANTPTRVLATDDDLDVIEKRIKAGFNTLTISPDASQAHYYMAPDTKSAEIASEVLKAKLDNFFLSGLRFYENSVKGRQKTATEINQDSAGERGFLAVLATATDEFEQQQALRLEQIEFPDRPDLWGQFSVNRSKEFKPLNLKQEANDLFKIFFSGPVPVGSSGRADAARKISDAYGVQYDPEEIDEEVGIAAIQDRQASAANAELNDLLNQV